MTHQQGGMLDLIGRQSFHARAHLHGQSASVLGVACVRQSADVVAVGGAGAGGGGGIDLALVSPGRVEVGGMGGEGSWGHRCVRVAQWVGQGCDGASAAAAGRRGGVATPLQEIAVHDAPVQLRGIERQAHEKLERQCSRLHRSYSVFILQHIMTTY